MDFEKNPFVFFTISSLLSCAKETRLESQRKINRKRAATAKGLLFSRASVIMRLWNIILPKSERQTIFGERRTYENIISRRLHHGWQPL
jgi:hypothetical protein